MLRTSCRELPKMAGALNLRVFSAVSGRSLLGLHIEIGGARAVPPAA